MTNGDAGCDMSSPLDELYAEIDQRVFAIIGQVPSWPCRKGCDDCCRHLAQVPELTEAEWKRLAQGIGALEPTIQTEIAHRMQALGDGTPGHFVCPLLDDVEGTCRVYAYRPAACRFFGFYQSRDANWWCEQIQARYETGELNDVIFGNQTAIERQLHQKGGKTKSLTDWFNLS